MSTLASPTVTSSLFEKDKLPEMFFMLLCWVIVYLTADLAFSYLFKELDLPKFAKYSEWFAWCIVYVTAIKTLRYFLVSVPEITALITVNLLTGRLTEHSTGLHFRFPWEQVKKDNYITLRTFLKDFGEGEDYPASDGVMVKVKWSFQYRGRQNEIAQFISVDKSVIDKGLHDIGSSFLGHIIANLTAQAARKNFKLIEKCMDIHFSTLEKPGLPAYHSGIDTAAHENTVLEKLGRYVADHESKLQNADITSYEKEYGIKMVLVAISDIDYEAKYQQALSGKAVADQINQAATTIQGEGADRMSRKDAYENAMVLNKSIVKTVNLSTQEIKGDGLNAVANFLMALANAMGGGKK